MTGARLWFSFNLRARDGFGGGGGTCDTWLVILLYIGLAFVLSTVLETVYGGTTHGIWRVFCARRLF